MIADLEGTTDAGPWASGASPGLTQGARKRRRRIAALITAVALTLSVVAVLALAYSFARGWTVLDDAQILFAVVTFALAFPVVGWVILRRWPDNRVGWVYLAIGLFQAINLFSGQYSALAFQIPSASLPLADVQSWIGAWAWAPGFTLFCTFGVLLFPDGHLPSRRWRLILVLAILAMALIAVPTAIALWPYRGGPLEAAAAGAQASLPADPALVTAAAFSGLGQLLLLAAMAGSVAGLATRFRRSAGVERQQLKWFTYGAAVDFTILIVWTTGVLDPLLGVLSAIIFALALPLAISLAILRHGLYDIDRIIGRTAVYVPLTAILAGIYAASIAFFQRLFVAVTGTSSDGAVILSTLVLAATFTPIKNWLQSVVDRRFRDPRDPEQRLEQFIGTVGAALAVEPGRTMRAFLGVAVEAFGASGGAAYLNVRRGERLIAETDNRLGVREVAILVEARGQRVGHLALDGRRGGRPYNTREISLMQTAGQQLADALLALPPAGARDEPTASTVAAIETAD